MNNIFQPAKLNLLKVLTALFFLMLTPIIFTANYANDYFEKLNREKNLHDIAHKIAIAIEADLNNKIIEQENLINSTFFKETPIESSSYDLLLAQYRTKSPYFTWVGVTDSKGFVLHDSPKLLTGVDVSQRPWFIYGHKEPYFGDPHNAKLLQNLIPEYGKDILRLLDISTPIFNDDKKLKGVISFHINWSWADQLIKNVTEYGSSSDRISIFISNGNNEIIYPSNHYDPINSNFLIGQEKVNVLRMKDGEQWQVLVKQPIHLKDDQDTSFMLWGLGFAISLISLLYLILSIFSMRHNKSGVA